MFGNGLHDCIRTGNYILKIKSEIGDFIGHNLKWTMYLTMLLKMEYHLTISLSRVNWSSGHHLESSPVPTFLLIRISSWITHSRTGNRDSCIRQYGQCVDEHLFIFTFVRWALYKNKSGSVCMDRTTFRDLWVGRPASWICRVTNRVHFVWTQTGRHSILNTTFANVINGNCFASRALEYRPHTPQTHTLYRCQQ